MLINVSTLIEIFNSTAARILKKWLHFVATSKVLNLSHIVMVLSLLLIPFEGKIYAEEKIATGKFVVSFIAEDNQKQWVVNALEQNIYNDLSGYARVVPFEKAVKKEKRCKKRKLNCILEIYQKLDVAALMLGTVDESSIDFEIYDIQTKSLVKTGSIGIGGSSSLLKLRLGAFNAFKPFIKQAFHREQDYWPVFSLQTLIEDDRFLQAAL